MTRFFYTDPLAAAWQAKHFGMETTNGFYFICNSDRGVIAAGGGDANGKYFVHPDSLHLLDVQVGDLISINGGDSANIATHDEFLAELKRLEPHFAKPLRIIQRKGLPFFWPEAE
jgi:hypothetical protein